MDKIIEVIPEDTVCSVLSHLQEWEVLAEQMSNSFRGAEILAGLGLHERAAMHITGKVRNNDQAQILLSYKLQVGCSLLC